MRVVVASLAVLTFSAGSAWATAFDSYRMACLETGGDLAKVRATAKAKGWGNLSDADREILAPGNERAVEGWAISDGGARYLVSIKAGAAGAGAGDLSDAGIATCTLSGPKTDDVAAIKVYADFLKRRPAGDENADGFRTATWQVPDGSGFVMHYYFGGTAATASIYSTSVVRK
ncbi:MAG: hypothetical protein GC190_01885 [Alphaproteobacteria bacterium]|nr:hypothetical protein [Alphaproteobacteria bacterium]